MMFLTVGLLPVTAFAEEAAGKESSDKAVVSFEANGGSGTMDPVSLDPDTSYTLPECGFNPPADMRFDAWGIEGRRYWPNDVYRVKADTVVKAIWRENIIWLGWASTDHTTLYEQYYEYPLDSEYTLPSLEEAEKSAGVDLGDGTLDHWEVWRFRPVTDEESGSGTLKKRWGEGSIGSEDGAATCDLGKEGDTIVLDTDIVLVPVFKATGLGNTGSGTEKDRIALYISVPVILLLAFAAVVLYRKKKSK